MLHLRCVERALLDKQLHIRNLTPILRKPTGESITNPKTNLTAGVNLFAIYRIASIKQVLIKEI